MAESPRSRRAALEALGLSLLGAAGLWRFLTPRHPRGPAAEPLVLAEEEVPADGALVLPHLGVAVVRDGAELLALDLTCTHLGCTVAATEGGFSCPCHGSRFGRCGRVLSGPAERSLRRLEVARQGGRILLDPARESRS